MTIIHPVEKMKYSGGCMRTRTWARGLGSNERMSVLVVEFLVNLVFAVIAFLLKSNRDDMLCTKIMKH